MAAVPEPVHTVAARGFGSAAGAYRRGRPGYPAEAVAHVAAALGIGEGASVLDLGAGTGKLTEAIAATGARVVAVEPVQAMREQLGQTLPGVEAIDGTADAIPLAPAAVDAVTVGQAFHWFATRAALGEIHRVLRPGGGLALLWNRLDESADWAGEVAEVVRARAHGAPSHWTGEWRSAFDGAPFSELEHRRFPNAHATDLHGLRDRFASVSYVASMDRRDRERLLDRVEEIARPRAAADGALVVPYRTDVWIARALPA